MHFLMVLLAKESKDLEDYLKEMSVKKVHLRVILQHHAKLTQNSTHEPRAAEESLVTVAPFVSDVTEFQRTLVETSPCGFGANG